MGRYTKVTLIETLRRADHIAIWDSSRFPIRYQHHGILWKEGTTLESILVCHIWSPLQNFRDAQADSCFRVSTLKEFLCDRNPKKLRLVEYHTSALRELLSAWGEVHLMKSDIPDVVIARCKFLMGLGKGEFNIFTQNCEHAAHWCKTGEQWCKQNLTKGKGSIPFEAKIPQERIVELETEIVHFKDQAMLEVQEILKLSNSRVYIRVNNTNFLHIKDDIVCVVPDTTSADPTPFKIFCYAKSYNCVKIQLFHEESKKYIFSRSTISCFRDTRMKKTNCLRGSTGLKWELSTSGNLRSMNQHRRYLGVRHDNVLVDVSIRCEAASFKIVPIDRSFSHTMDVSISRGLSEVLSTPMPKSVIVEEEKSQVAEKDHDVEVDDVVVDRLPRFSTGSWKTSAYRELVDKPPSKSMLEPSSYSSSFLRPTQSRRSIGLNMFSTIS